MRTLSHAEFLALRRFDALDGLRAVAAVIVIFFHCGGAKTAFLSGWIGVHIFFVVSGFLITTLMLREKDRTGRISLRGFYLRRIFRIVPLYYLVLAATAVGVYRSGYSWSVLRNHLPHFLGFMGEYHLAGDTPYLHAWTIGIEQKFYLVWPLALVLASAVSRKLRVPLAVAAIVLALVPWSPTWKSMGIHYSVLLTGALLAVVLHHRRGYALFRPLTHPLVGVAVLAAFLVLHLHLSEMTKYFGGELTVIFLYGLGVAALLPSLFGPGPGRWALSLRPLVFVGERSYALYLVQALAVGVVAVLAPWLPGGTPLFATAVTLVSLFAADGLYRWVEQPMIGNGRRLIKWLDGRFPTSRPAVPAQSAAEPTPDRRAPVAAGWRRSG
ncbi:acyltransferase [Kitasatospora sp. NPDC002040]|uniref:acyltransferase family protein n=1 Tax=Kitasatospora sp. NPDC002040 TaxID=3154661 RepID=UPI00332DB8E6